MRTVLQPLLRANSDHETRILYSIGACFLRPHGRPRGAERTRIRGDNENHSPTSRDLHSEFASRQRSQGRADKHLTANAVSFTTAKVFDWENKAMPGFGAKLGGFLRGGELHRIRCGLRTRESFYLGLGGQRCQGLHEC